MFKCPYEFAGSSCMSGGCLGFLDHQQYGCQVVPGVASKSSDGIHAEEMDREEDAKMWNPNLR